MRRFIVGLLASVLLATGLTVAYQTPAFAVNWQCRTELDGNDLTFSGNNNFVGRDVFVRFDLYYTYCYDPAGISNSWVEADWSVNAYNVEGGNIDCGFLTRWLEGVRFNWYFWRPYTGASFNPSPFELPCRTDGTDAHIQQYEPGEQPRLQFGPADMRPRWKITVTVQYENWPDDQKSYEQAFRPFN